MEIPHGTELKQSLLETKSVYILDCHTDVFVWCVASPCNLELFE